MCEADMILKLVSGEEIWAEMIKCSDGVYTFLSPMAIKRKHRETTSGVKTIYKFEQYMDNATIQLHRSHIMICEPMSEFLSGLYSQMRVEVEEVQKRQNKANNHNINLH